ncbi:hypothetical protein C7S17_7364 [Burkholderia thailandensis]|nr:hypothetical protein [Burkholderia thailandensis]
MFIPKIRRRGRQIRMSPEIPMINLENYAALDKCTGVLKTVIVVAISSQSGRDPVFT